MQNAPTMETAPTMEAAPTTRIGWHSYYAQRYNRTGNPEAAVMACWYYLLHLAFDGDA